MKYIQDWVSPGEEGHVNSTGALMLSARFITYIYVEHTHVSARARTHQKLYINSSEYN